ncbi:alpha/beta hydrolase [Streptomyces tagetis]|uniref:Alpha/beta hydrolase n=1 Tax=Streptomyces tagetis TaxID=2820809 RepID=A0A941B0C6_9ACTN|nr:alpha/beta hydrolase [Streptomyces sp. RG38]MBQ0826571.1 alpha/beta hydrolase [Streptomyces sp. RG38]
MPLDRILRSLIAWQRADGPPPPARALGIAEARERYRANAVLADAAPPEGVTRADRPVAAGDGTEIPCRVYTPEGDGDRVVTYLHGGGWVVGDLDSHDGVCRGIAAALGAVVVSVGYRRAPEFPYPTPLRDAVAAARWTSRVFPGRAHVLAGDSAGAALAVGVALDARDNGGLRPAAQLLIYPPADPRLLFAAAGAHAEGYLLTVDDMAYHYDLYVPDRSRRRDPAVDLLGADLRHLPPAVVATAEFDPLHDEGVELADKLAVAGVPVRHVPGPGLVHGYFLMQGVVPSAAACAGRVLRETDALLRSAPGIRRPAPGRAPEAAGRD